MRKLAMIFLCLCSMCWADDNLKLLIGPKEISEKLDEVAAQIDEDYRDKNLTIVMVMKGAVCVTADLIRKLHTPLTLEYIKASSYGQRGSSRGELKIIGFDQLDLTDKDVLIVDDIFDTGNTMATLVDRLQEKQPRSLKSLILLLKNVPHHTSYRPDYTLFEIEDRFVVGYGLDYKEHYRELPGIYYFDGNPP